MSGPECCSNPPTLDSTSGDGHVDNFAGLNSHVTGSPHSNRAILFLSDIFGYEAPLLRKLADKVAAAGYYVVVPDFFNGDPIDLEDVNRPLPVWLKDHEPEKGFEAAKPIIEALKSKGASAVGAVGFCWGAMAVCDLGKSRLIEVSAILHPAFINVDHIDGVNVPIAILGAELDTVTPPELVNQFEQVLNAKPEVDSYVKVFPNVPHGWTTRYNPEDPEAVKSAEEAHQILLDWFDKYLK
ncbi:endo-1,3;1,4-beta-D-glucanase-like [Abrus precatorius]|uniref:Endo-1,31,4-beta-D-glucanase-like n=1 Tax=Abrus precatorius TaxID=3816 RepID=A0A8B8JLX5_ABRPR|nr:endo-1,3;1,4-beta-D-glucanase-like [Abrus precatorius]